MTMASFQCITSPLRLFQGADSLSHLGRELDRAGSLRAVIVCGGTLSRDEGLIGRVKSAIGGRLAGVVAGVKAHSPLPVVEDITEEIRRLDADAVVAVGGGSAIVTSRAASILLAEKRPVSEMCTVPDGKGGLKSPRLMAQKLPQFVVLSTPTTAGVKAGSAVFDPVKGERLALFDPKTRAQAIFVDPDMLASAPRSLVLSAGVNTLSTAIEGLMSRSGNPIADAMLMHCVRLIAGRFETAADLGDVGVRGDITIAAILCGQGTDHTGAGITTVLGHALGARFDTENGIVNAVVLPHVLDFNGRFADVGCAKVGAALGLPTPRADLLPELVPRLRKIFDALGLPARLRDIGVPADALRQTAELAMSDWFLRGNPRPVENADELFAILQRSW